MIKIHFSQSEDNFPPEIEMSGSIKELKELSRSILMHVNNNIGNNLFITMADYDPSPYDNILKGLRLIIENNSPINIDICNNELVLTCSMENVETFLSYLNILREGGHSHFEYIEGNKQINQNSLPIVISAGKSGKNK